MSTDYAPGEEAPLLPSPCRAEHRASHTVGGDKAARMTGSPGKLSLVAQPGLATTFRTCENAPTPSAQRLFAPARGNH